VRGGQAVRSNGQKTKRRGGSVGEKRKGVSTLCITEPFGTRLLRVKVMCLKNGEATGRKALGGTMLKGREKVTKAAGRHQGICAAREGTRLDHQPWEGTTRKSTHAGGKKYGRETWRRVR